MEEENAQNVTLSAQIAAQKVVHDAHQNTSPMFKQDFVRSVKLQWIFVLIAPRELIVINAMILTFQTREFALNADLFVAHVFH